MIVKVLNSAPSARSPLMYNEFKVHQGLAEICAVENIESTNFPDIWNTIVGREKNNRRTEKPSIHITFNPGVDDNMTPEDMLNFIPKWMQMVGLGNQPYAIYYHHDIVRGHYHVVSTKLRECGTSVRTNNLRYKNLDAMKQLAKEYPFFIGKGLNDQKAMSREERHKVLELKGFDPFKFDASKSNVWDQIDLIYTSVIRDFTYRSDAEFRTIMEACGLEVLLSPSKYDGQHMVVHYRDEDGKKTGRPRTYGNEDYKLMSSQIKREYKPKTGRSAQVVRDALNKAQTIKEFEDALIEQEITPRYFQNKGGTYQGVSFVDYHDFQVVKASELGELNQAIRAAYTSGLIEAQRILQEKDAKEKEEKKKREQEKKELEKREKEAAIQVTLKRDFPILRTPAEVEYLKTRGRSRYGTPEYLSRKLSGREINVYVGSKMRSGIIITPVTIDGEDYTVKYDPATQQSQFTDGFIYDYRYELAEFRDYPEGDYLTKKEAQLIAETRTGGRIVQQALQRAFPQSEIVLHEAQTTTGEAGVWTVAFATIDGKQKTVLLKGYETFAIADGFVKRDIAYRTRNAIKSESESSTRNQFGLFRLIRSLSSLRGLQPQTASSNISKKRKDIWEESLKEGEKEERQRKKREIKGVSW